jgi:hypothetical protein
MRTNECNDPVFKEKGINTKLNNLLGFDDFKKTFKPKEQKSTKRTDVGLDIINEQHENEEIGVGDTVLFTKPNLRIMNAPAYGTIEKRNGKTTTGKKKWTVRFDDPQVLKGFKIKGGLRLTISETQLKKQ